MVKEVQGPVTAGRGVKTTFIELLGSNPPPLLCPSDGSPTVSTLENTGLNAINTNNIRNFQFH